MKKEKKKVKKKCENKEIKIKREKKNELVQKKIHKNGDGKKEIRKHEVQRCEKEKHWDREKKAGMEKREKR